MDKLTLRKLYNTDFPTLYWKILRNVDSISDFDYETILALGTFLINLEDDSLQKLGYRLFLMYSKATRDYKPLYKVS